MTLEEYLATDKASELPLEYRNGDVFQAFDASPSHAGLTAMLCASLVHRLKGTQCTTYAALQVRISPVQYVYPDVAVVCGQPALTSERDQSVSNPKVIFEILSPATQDYDYGSKFLLYRQLASIEEYVLISRDQPRAEVFRRAPQDKWILSTYEGVETTLILESLDRRIPLRELYA
jgi:Uma2 family endonuclease